jgi:long-chain fatty acid transport protein
MRTINRSVKVSSLAFGIISALACTQAMASGFQIRENSVQAVSRAFAGSASDWGDAAVVNNNPAAMTLFTETTFQSDVTVIDVSAKFTGGGHDAFGRPLTGGDGGDAGNATPVPAMHLVVPMGHWAFGAAITAPFGLKTEYDPGWVGRYQALKSSLKTYDLTLAGAYKFNDMFSIGAGLIIQRADAELSKAVDFGAILTPAAFPAFQPQSADGLARIKGNDTATGWEAGLLFRPGPNTNIGLNYRSKINHTISGTADFTVPANVQAVFTAFHSPFFQDQAASAALATPSVATFSITQKLNDRVALSANVERTQWSSLQEIRVNFAGPDADSVEQFHWRNTMLFSIGGDFKLNDTVTLRAGYAHDETPTSDAFRTPRLPDNNRNIFSVGLGWNPSKNVDWNIGFSHIAIKKPTVNDATQTGSTLVGSYDAKVNLFGVSGTFEF